MKTLSKLATAAAALTLLAGAHAYAADQGGVQVGGSIKQTTLVNKNVNLAVGNRATAVTSIGSIHGKVKTGGSIKQTTLVNKNVNLAVGNRSKACTSIGSIGSAPGC